MKIDGSSPPTVSVTTSNFFIRCFSTKKEEGLSTNQIFNMSILFGKHDELRRRKELNRRSSHKIKLNISKNKAKLIMRFQAVNLLLAAILLFLSFKAYTTVKFADACLQTLKGEFEIIHVHMLIHR
ncbi:unnamed protein product [Vicia faba]|uniref:Transmembrane protein n=1 Tax=Vicia faba TaxID=3906 RepID=A0AAV0Z036_VICFA|nr:unnamed protein product [Vicia faba]